MGIINEKMKAKQWTKGQSGNPGGRKPNIVKEANNRALFLQHWHEISERVYGQRLSEEDLAKKPFLYVITYRMALNDPRSFIAQGCGQPRQAVDMNVSEIPTEDVEELRKEFACLVQQKGKRGKGVVRTSKGSGSPD